jgi:hypothetical protein
MPELVSEGHIAPAAALVIDERLGFPHTFGGDDRLRTGRAARLVAALFEEKRPDTLSDAQIAEFLQDAAKLPDRYVGMLRALERAGAQVVRYSGDIPRQFLAGFADIGLEILGPSREQLEQCRAYLERVGSDAVDRLSDADGLDDIAGEVRLYREAVRRLTADEEAQDRVGPGAGKNDQSLVLKLAVGGRRILLTGDMQFAEPEVQGLDDAMAALRRAVVAGGPYDFVKIAHHGSYNAFDESVIGELAATPAFGMSSGTNDRTHPAAPVLRLLGRNRDRIHWARTDRNGLVTVTFEDATPTLHPSRGRLNDATPNSDAGAVAVSTAAAAEVVTTRGPGPQEFNVSARVAEDVDEVTITVALKSREPAAGVGRHDRPRATGAPALDGQLASGRALPALLFVTQSAGLSANIGPAAAAATTRMIESAGQTLLDVRAGAPVGDQVRRELATGRYKGVVLVGGYDVLPALRLDVLDPPLRQALGSRVSLDADRFIVWSDAIYGDADGDRLPEFPVSRVPDGASSRLVAAALTGARAGNPLLRFGLRNVARPFASDVFALMQGQGDLRVSAPTTAAMVGRRGGAGDHLYFMAHGSDDDGTRFWGEADGEMLEAFNVTNVPDSISGVVFSGCCWGALIVQESASRVQGPGMPAARTPESSIALALLQAGAIAFVGCTGSHYSPVDEPYDYFGGPMHRAFWAHLRAGKAPAEALFAAKTEYAVAMPHGQTRADGRAIEMKILRQYTCLGVGW